MLGQDRRARRLTSCGFALARAGQRLAARVCGPLLWLRVGRRPSKLPAVVRKRLRTTTGASRRRASAGLGLAVLTVCARVTLVKAWRDVHGLRSLARKAIKIAGKNGVADDGFMASRLSSFNAYNLASAASCGHVPLLLTSVAGRRIARHEVACTSAHVGVSERGLTPHAGGCEHTRRLKASD